MNWFKSSSTSESSNNDNDEIICIECDKKTQKDLPSNDSVSSKGMACEVEYSVVSNCMRENSGQISSCKAQWDDFKLCHEQNSKR